jgi:hypothetical protein
MREPNGTISIETTIAVFTKRPKSEELLLALREGAATTPVQAPRETALLLRSSFKSSESS